MILDAGTVTFAEHRPLSLCMEITGYWHFEFPNESDVSKTSLGDLTVSECSGTTSKKQQTKHVFG